MLLTGTCSGPVLAQGLSGASLELQWYAPDLSTAFGFPSTVVVGPGVESPGYWFGNLDVDVTDSQLIVTALQDVSFNPATYNGFVLSDTTANLASITSVSLNGSTDVTGFDGSRVYWTADDFGVNLQGLTALQGEQIVLDIVAPAPAGALLLVTAAAIPMRRRRPISVRA